MSTRIQNAHVHGRGVVLRLPRRTFQISFRQKPVATDGALFVDRQVHTQSAVLGIAWKPTAVLPRDFRLP
jgi:hypothetical protein